MKDISTEFGINVKSRRTELGLTQDDLAEKSEVDRSHISDIENGKANPSLLTMHLLAEALKITLSDLLKIE